MWVYLIMLVAAVMQCHIKYAPSSNQANISEANNILAKNVFVLIVFKIFFLHRKISQDNDKAKRQKQWF